MEYKQKIYIWTVMLAGAATLGFCSIKVCQQFVTQPIQAMQIINWLIMLVLLVLCRALPVYIAKDKSIEVSFVPVVASAMIYGLYLTVLLFFLSTFFLFVFDATNRKIYYLLLKNPEKELFNAANIVLSIFIGGQPLILMGGYGDSFSFPYSILPAAVFAVVTITTNLALFILYYVSKGKERFISMLSRTISGVFPNVCLRFQLYLIKRF